RGDDERAPRVILSSGEHMITSRAEVLRRHVVPRSTRMSSMTGARTRPANERHGVPLRAIVIGLIVVGLAVLLLVLPLRSLVDRLHESVARMGAWGPVLWGTVTIVGGLLLVPGSILTIGA